MRRSVVLFLVVVASTACGRLGFDVAAGGADAGTDANRPIGQDVGVARDAFLVRDSAPDAVPGRVDAAMGLDPDLVVWLTFDGALDLPSDAIGTLGEPVCAAGQCPTVVPGVFGDAYDFDGVDDYLQFAFVPALDFGASSRPFSVAVWYRSRASGPAQQVIVAKATSGGDVSFQITLEELDASSGYDVAFKVCNVMCGTEPAAIYSNGATVGSWHLVVGVWTGSEEIVYVDGIEKGRAALPGMKFDDQPFMVGADLESGNSVEDFFDGQIDDLRIYRRVLTPDQQMDLMIGASP